MLGTFLRKTKFDVASPSTIESPARSRPLLNLDRHFQSSSGNVSASGA